jgi:hypothetical protein
VFCKFLYDRLDAMFAFGLFFFASSYNNEEITHNKVSMGLLWLWILLEIVLEALLVLVKSTGMMLKVYGLKLHALAIINHRETKISLGLLFR